MDKNNPKPKPNAVARLYLAPQIGGRRTPPKPTLEQLDANQR